ncbi:hypothetical protein FF1_017765 [Malus domestica]
MYAPIFFFERRCEGFFQINPDEQIQQAAEDIFDGVDSIEEHIASADYSVQRARQAKAAADETAREREIQLQKAEARAERVRGDNPSSGVKVKCFSCCGA